MFWLFTVWIDCSTDLKYFANSQPSASNFKSFSRPLEQFFLTVSQNNFGNKIPFLESGKNLNKQFLFFLRRIDTKNVLNSCVAILNCFPRKSLNKHFFLKRIYTKNVLNSCLSIFRYFPRKNSNKHFFCLHLIQWLLQILVCQSNGHFSSFECLWLLVPLVLPIDWKSSMENRQKHQGMLNKVLCFGDLVYKKGLCN